MNDGPFSSSINNGPFSSSINDGPFSSSINNHPFNRNNSFSLPAIEESTIRDEESTIRETDEIELRDDADILFISTHGSIMCDEIECEIDNKPKLTQIPEGMEVIKITFATEGCVNMTSLGTYDFTVFLINHFKNELLSTNDYIFNETINYIVKELKSIQVDQSNILLKDINKKIRQTNDPKKIKAKSNYQMGFIHAVKNSVKKYLLKEGDFIMDKQYSRSPSDDKMGEYDFTITAINSIDTKDVLSEIRRITRFGDQSITTEELLDYFKRKGTNKLIIFDFSCSVYHSSYYHNNKKYIRQLSNAENRRLRRETTYPYGGYKYVNKSNKSNKNKSNKTNKNKSNKSNKKKTKKRKLKKLKNF